MTTITRTNISKLHPNLSNLSFTRSADKADLRFTVEHLVQLGRALAQFKYGNWRLIESQCTDSRLVIFKKDLSEARCIRKETIVHENRPGYGTSKRFSTVWRTYDLPLEGGVIRYSTMTVHPIVARVKQCVKDYAASKQQSGKNRVHSDWAMDKYSIMAAFLAVMNEGRAFVVDAGDTLDRKSVYNIITDGYRRECAILFGYSRYSK